MSEMALVSGAAALAVLFLCLWSFERCERLVQQRRADREHDWREKAVAVARHCLCEVQTFWLFTCHSVEQGTVSFDLNYKRRLKAEYERGLKDGASAEPQKPLPSLRKTDGKIV